MSTFHPSRLIVVALWLCSAVACAQTVETNAFKRHDAGCFYDDLAFAWISPHAGFGGKRQVLRAAASRNSHSQLARKEIEQFEANEDRLEFAVEVLAVGRRRESIALLEGVATNGSASRRVRFAAVQALESFAGATYEPPKQQEAPGQRSPLEPRVNAISKWLSEHAPEVDGLEVDRAADAVRGCVKQLDVYAQRDRSIENHALEGHVNCIQTYCELLAWSQDSQKVASILVEHLHSLQSLPTANPADKLDRVVGLLEYQAIRAMESHVGPVAGMNDGLSERSQVRRVGSELLDWWASAKEKSPIEWRMERLAAAGYRTSSAEPGPIIGSELLRAIRSGTPAECRAAADVLKALGIGDGTVPMRDDDPQSDVLITDALIRAQVTAEAAQALLGGMFPYWDGDTKSWKAGNRP